MRGGLWIADYMRRCDIGFFEAAELVITERRTLICAALARVAERERCDDGEAYETLLAYGPKMPETVHYRESCRPLPPDRGPVQTDLEFDRLVRSIYTLNYFRDAQLQRDVHRSQNRLE